MRTDRRINAGEPTNVGPSFAEGKAKIPGHGRGDKIPALLEPGEVVLTRNAAETMGRDNIDALNKSSTRRGASMSGLEVAMHAHADREHPVVAKPGRMR